MATGRKSYMYRLANASNSTEDAVETNDLTELCRVLFIEGLAARISVVGGGTASYLTYPGQKFSA